MLAPSGRGGHPQAGKRYRGSRRRIRRLVREETTPIGIWIMLIVTILLILTMFSRFSRDDWLGIDPQITIK